MDAKTRRQQLEIIAEWVADAIDERENGKRFGAVGDGLIRRIVEACGVDKEKVAAIFEQVDPEQVGQIIRKASELLQYVTRDDKTGRILIDVRVLL